MGSAVAPPQDKSKDKGKGKPAKPELSPAELRKSLGLPETATDQEVRSAQKIERFKTVAKRRTDKALQEMHNLTRCANRGNYSYTAEQVKTITDALYAEVAKVEAAFANTSGEDKPQVEL